MNFKKICILFLLLNIISCSSKNHDEIFLQKEPITADEQLFALKEGNARFLSDDSTVQDFHFQINKTKNGQKPYAVILSCIDSRVPAEIVFDQGIGQIFVVRIAGSVENPDILGSLEFATALAGAKLIVVLGHTKCGAIKGACQNAKLGHLTPLLKRIRPAVEEVKRSTENFDSDSYEHVDLVTKENVKRTISSIRSKSSVIRDLERLNKVKIVGAMYDVSSGEVRFQ